MKYSLWYKGVLFIALTCSFTAKGSALDTISGSKNLTANRKNAVIGNVVITAGQSQNFQASVNLTVSGENNPVTVEKEGMVTLTAGKSILLLPGTKISAGGFLYATIEPAVKSGNHPKKEIRLVTVEENMKIEEQASLSVAFVLFSPFPSPGKGYLHAGDARNGSFSASSNELSAVYPGQQRKVAIDSRTVPEITRNKMLLTWNPIPVACGYRPETMRVLRL